MLPAFLAIFFSPLHRDRGGFHGSNVVGTWGWCRWEHKVLRGASNPARPAHTRSGSARNEDQRRCEAAKGCTSSTAWACKLEKSNSPVKQGGCQPESVANTSVIRGFLTWTGAEMA